MNDNLYKTITVARLLKMGISQQSAVVSQQSIVNSDQ